jgi:hypothetical protein
LLKEDASSLDVTFWENLLGRLESQKEPLYDRKQRMWLPASKYPAVSASWTPTTGVEFCVFLNTLATVISNILGLPVIRKFTADYSTARLWGHSAICKPDITLFHVGCEPKDIGGRALWRCVQSCVEMKNVISRGVKMEAMIRLAGELVTLASALVKLSEE